MEQQAGRIGPPPAWVGYVLAARWYGADPWDLVAQDDAEFWKEAGLLMREIESESHRKARKA